ncbi:uncharacterized protein LOC131845028 [Achroia grisella]|uniref:uncharacterized protein LOC131845028 n=1 Tax=Achroia grisella TaxID=688607 RepID=UPI0027D2C479|nr:uncharacterized protein LOC131845028 [Achroia grisella]
MNWSNENVIEFLELLQGEPCIWNPKSTEHKNRNLNLDAWMRIKNNFSLPCSIQDLKRKRNSLLTQYRQYIKKIKDSTKIGNGADVYKPSWFAFDTMNNFLAALYDYHPTACIEDSTDEKDEELVHKSLSMESNMERPLSPEPIIIRPIAPHSNSSSESESYPIRKRRRVMQDILRIKEHNDDEYFPNKKVTVECDLYGQLLAQKLKPLNTNDRLVLMNEIDNLVFKYVMNIRKRNSETTIYVPPMNPTTVQPGPSTMNTQSPDVSKET